MAYDLGLPRTRYLYLVREEEEEEGTSQTRFSVVKRLEGPFSTFSMPTTEWLLNNEFALTIMDIYKKVSVWSVLEGGNKVHTADFSGVWQGHLSSELGRPIVSACGRAVALLCNEYVLLADFSPSLDSGWEREPVWRSVCLEFWPMMLSFLRTDTSSSSALLAVLGHRDAGDGSGEYERRLEVLRVDLSSKGVLGRDLSPLLPPGRFLVFHNSWFTFRPRLSHPSTLSGDTIALASGMDWLLCCFSFSARDKEGEHSLVAAVKEEEEGGRSRGSAEEGEAEPLAVKKGSAVMYENKGGAITPLV